MLHNYFRGMWNKTLLRMRCMVFDQHVQFKQPWVHQTPVPWLICCAGEVDFCAMIRAETFIKQAYS
jgi:hypothetical protein